MTLYLHEQQIMRKSMEEGMEKGIQKGRQKGMLEERELAIRNMLKKLSAEEIIELGYERELVMKITKEK